MFDTTNMASFAENHKCVDSDVAREATRCVWLTWAAQQMHITPHLQGVLVRLVTLMDAAGAVTLTQKEIAAAIRMSERQTRAAIADLVKGGVIERKRRGGVGAGRVCDVLQAKTATGATPPLAMQPATDAISDSGDMTPEATGDKAQPATGGTSPLSQPASVDSGESPPVDSDPRACIEHASARAEANLKNTTSSEDNLQTPETRGSGGFELDGDPSDTPKRVQRKRHQKFVATGETLPAEITDAMRTIATEAGLVNGTCEAQFNQWRRYHIENETVMTFVNRSWQTWVNNWLDRKSGGQKRAAGGKRQITLGNGQVAFTKSHKPTMRAARA